VTSARKREISCLLSRELKNSTDIRLLEIVQDLVNEVKPIDDTRPNKCVVCGRITYFDPATQRHHCKYCDLRGIDEGN
jgi:hypothetical protein